MTKSRHNYIMQMRTVSKLLTIALFWVISISIIPLACAPSSCAINPPDIPDSGAPPGKPVPPILGENERYCKDVNGLIDIVNSTGVDTVDPSK